MAKACGQVKAAVSCLLGPAGGGQGGRADSGQGGKANAGQGGGLTAGRVEGSAARRAAQHRICTRAEGSIPCSSLEPGRTVHGRRKALLHLNTVASVRSCDDGGAKKTRRTGLACCLHTALWVITSAMDAGPHSCLSNFQVLQVLRRPGSLKTTNPRPRGHDAACCPAVVLQSTLTADSPGAGWPADKTPS